VGGNSVRSLTYDGRGRRKTDTFSGATSTYAWDAESRLLSVARPGVTTNAFGYNGLDARVSKTDSSGTFGFKRNGAGVTDPVLSDGAATYTPGISERRGGNSKFLHSGMKNADAQSGASANVDSSRTYDAFGNLTGSSGTWSGPFGYAGGFGYQEDPDHGLRLLGHRYYDSSTGRLISKDPIGDGRNWPRSTELRHPPLLQ
jgi:RHS repeat-associated protein